LWRERRVFAKFGFYGGTWGCLIDSHRIGKAALGFSYTNPMGHFKIAFSIYSCKLSSKISVLNLFEVLDITLADF
jgi:hypothetical protein